MMAVEFLTEVGMDRCSHHCCNNLINWNKAHYLEDGKMFCTASCVMAWKAQNEIFKFAARGAPIAGRRPHKPPKWKLPT